MTEAIISLSDLRILALHAQHLTHANGTFTAPGRDALAALARDLVFIQIDTLQMVHRAHYLTLWSRLGAYDIQDFDALSSPADRRLYEYWGHAASFMPLDYFRYSVPFMKKRQMDPTRWTLDWLTREGSPEAIAVVRERITREGALRSADFADPNHRGGPWWDWKPAKHALEYLFNTGELMVDRRERFQRYYDLAERVLPSWVEQGSLTLEEAQAFYVERAVRALGVCRPQQVAEYAYMGRQAALPHLKDLIKKGDVVSVKGLLMDGQPADLVIHRENIPVLERIHSGEITAERTTFLNPFDNLFWSRGRDRDFWGFTQALEAYKKSHDRIYGYFTLPILVKGRLVGRFDPKLERKEKRLYLRALLFDEGITVTDEMIAAIAVAMADFLRFHHAQDLVVEKSTPADAGARLVKALEKEG